MVSATYNLKTGKLDLEKPIGEVLIRAIDILSLETTDDNGVITQKFSLKNNGSFTLTSTKDNWNLSGKNVTTIASDGGDGKTVTVTINSKDD